MAAGIAVGESSAKRPVELHRRFTVDADAYERARALCGNSAERAYLQRRLDEMLNVVPKRSRVGGQR